MKLRASPLLLALICALAVGAAGAEFQEGIPLKAGGEVIDVTQGHLMPTVMDWNDDGKKDLVVGQFKGGRIRLYLNEGSDAAPAFGASKFLEAGGAEIRLPAG